MSARYVFAYGVFRRIKGVANGYEFDEVFPKAFMFGSRSDSSAIRRAIVFINTKTSKELRPPPTWPVALDKQNSRGGFDRVSESFGNTKEEVLADFRKALNRLNK